MSTMSVLDSTGDTKIIWSADNADEVDNAEKMFRRLRKKGYIAYRVEASGDRGEIMTEFDAEAEKIILAPALQGG